MDFVIHIPPVVLHILFYIFLVVVGVVVGVVGFLWFIADAFKPPWW